MKTAAILLAAATGASAFTSPQPSSGSTAVRAAMDEYSGSIDLRGKEFKFDPVSRHLVPSWCVCLALFCVLFFVLFLAFFCTV